MKHTIMIGGITVLLEACFEPVVEEAHLPFFKSMTDYRVQNACQMIMTSVKTLPPLPTDSFSAGCRHYHRSFPDSVWFSLWAESPVFAFVDYSEAPAVVKVDYLPDKLETVAASRTLLRLLEVERLFNLFGGFMLHGSLISAPQGGIVFSGPSGIGKSTQASLWEKYAGADILNGDRCALLPGISGWTGWGLPYAGTSGIYINRSTPVKAVILLEQADRNRLESVGMTEAFSYLYPQINHLRWNKELVGLTTDALIKLLKELPVYRLSCRPDEEAVLLLRREAFGE